MNTVPLFLTLGPLLVLFTQKVVRLARDSFTDRKKEEPLGDHVVKFGL